MRASFAVTKLIFGPLTLSIRSSNAPSLSRHDSEDLDAGRVVDLPQIKEVSETHFRNSFDAGGAFGDPEWGRIARPISRFSVTM